MKLSRHKIKINYFIAFLLETNSYLKIMHKHLNNKYAYSDVF